LRELCHCGLLALLSFRCKNVWISEGNVTPYGTLVLKEMHRSVSLVETGISNHFRRLGGAFTFVIAGA